MNSNTFHENEMLSFSAYLSKRKLELKGMPEKQIEEKATYEWKLIPNQEKIRFYRKIQEDGFVERHPERD